MKDEGFGRPVGKEPFESYYVLCHSFEPLVRPWVTSLSRPCFWQRQLGSLLCLGFTRRPGA